MAVDLSVPVDLCGECTTEHLCVASHWCKAFGKVTPLRRIVLEPMTPAAPAVAPMPCPCCLGTDIVVGRVTSSERTEPAVRCRTCGIHGTLASWNTRTRAESTEVTVEAAVRAGCTAADIHLKCTYPACRCKAMPTAIRAALTAGIQP